MFFKICLSKYRHAISRQLSYHQCLICIFDVNTLLLLLFKYIHIQPVNPQSCGSFAGNLPDFGFITNKFDPDFKLLQAWSRFAWQHGLFIPMSSWFTSGPCRTRFLKKTIPHSKSKKSNIVSDLRRTPDELGLGPGGSDAWWNRTWPPRGIFTKS
jgi:hypothetical protein